MTPHSSTLAWKIPWTEEPGRLKSMGSRRVGHDWATSLSLFLSCIGEGNGNPLQYSCLENPRDRLGLWGHTESDMTGRLPFHFSFHALEKEMATHSNVLVWRIPGMGEPGGLPSMGSRRVVLIHFSVFLLFYFCERCYWDFDRGCMETVDCFR